MNNDKLIKELFVGKVAEILGFEKTTELLKESADAINRTNLRGNEQLHCPSCKSADLKTAIHTEYKECNKCYHYWEKK